MKTYKAIKKTPDSNTIIEDLNAKVLSMTFKSKKAVQDAEVCVDNGIRTVIGKGHCSPVLTTFEMEIKVEF